MNKDNRNLPVGDDTANHRTRRPRRSRLFATVLGAVLASLVVIGATAGPASASLEFGPASTGGTIVVGGVNGTGVGYASLSVSSVVGSGVGKYAAWAQTPWTLRQSGVWVQAAVYARNHSGGAWTLLKTGSAVLVRGTADTSGSATVISGSFNGAVNGSYDVAMYFRWAVPGGGWSAWSWDPASSYNTYYRGYWQNTTMAFT